MGRGVSEADYAEVIDAPSFVAGRWARSESWVDRFGPYVERVVSRSSVSDMGTVAEAISFAKDGAVLVRSLAPWRRAEILDRAAELARERAEQVAFLLALELGKPLRDGLTEMVRVADTFAIASSEARRLGGELLGAEGWERGHGTTVLTYRAPVGVVVAITPFNSPANLLAHKVAASFAAGNSTIVKPPPQAAAVSNALVSLLLDAGMPPEAIQIVHGGAEIGSSLVAADEVAAVSFTGSAPTGDAVARAAGPKRLVLELGGNAATIVCSDADVEAAAASCASSGFTNSGQSCISVQRIYVQESVIDRFLVALVDRVGKLQMGDPLDEKTQVGSMVDESAARRVVSWIDEAQSSGAEVLIGGTRHCAVVAPTIVSRPSIDSKVVVEEVFGPLVVVIPYGHYRDVLKECNRSRFGLQAGVFTTHLPRVFQAWRELEVGGLVVNGTSNFRLDHAPFGGMKDSGMGRESPRWMIEEYTSIRTMLLKGISLWADVT